MYYQQRPKEPYTKRESQEIHARRRAMERYGVEVSLRDIVKMIKYGKSHFVRRQSNRIAIHDVFYKGKKMRVVYDNQRKMIVTFLFPKE